MPTSNSAKKRLRQNTVRRQRNRTVRSELKTVVRKVREAATTDNGADAAESLRTAVRKLDQAVSRGILHRNAASRTKSRLTAAVKRAQSK